MGYSQTAATTSITASATTAKPQAFQSRSIDAASDDDTEDVFETQAQTHLGYRQQQHLQQQQQHHHQQQQQQPLYDYSQSEEDQEEPPRQQYQTRKQQQQQSYRANSKQKQSSEEETEEEEEEPDRLSMLLAQSKFACNGKTTG